jgi:hypothetical protein
VLINTHLFYFLCVDPVTTDFSDNPDDILRRLSLDPKGVLLFASGDYVYQSLDISRVSIWDRQLTSDEVAALGVIE